MTRTDRSDPDVSVVIPTMDRSDRLARTISGVLAQRGVRIEVIVVHDGPSRGGLASIKNLGDSRLRLIETHMHGGMAATRNAGIRAAAAEWVAFCDDDDLWSPTKLLGQVGAAAAAGAGFAYSSVVSIDDRDRMIAVFPAPDPEGLGDALLARNVIPAGSSNILVRREALRAVGDWDESLAHLSDWDMWIRLATTLKPAAVAAIGVAYVQHLGGASLRSETQLLHDFHLVTEKHAALAASRAVAPDLSAFTRFVAERQRRAGRPRAAARLYLSVARRDRSVRDLALAAHALSGLPVPKRRRPAPQEWINGAGDDATAVAVPSTR